MDGNPLDACSIAAQVALQCTRIPRTEAIPGESGLLEDFEVIGDLAESTLVQAQGVPVFVTVAKVRHTAFALLFAPRAKLVNVCCVACFFVSYPFF